MSTHIKASEVVPAQTNMPEGFVPHNPFFLPRHQSYYWTSEWQKGEAEADEEIQNGEARRFTNTADAIRWLDA